MMNGMKTVHQFHRSADVQDKSQTFGSTDLSAGDYDDHHVFSILDSGQDLHENMDYDYRTNLIVNYLPPTMSQEQFKALFENVGKLDSCKLIKDKASGQSLGYGFINYTCHEDAVKAIDLYNGLKLQFKVIKVSFARPSSEAIKGANLYLCGLPKTMTQKKLEQLFLCCGKIITSRLLIDNETEKPKGVGFIRFDKRCEAEEAIRKFHGTVLAGGTETLTVKFANSQNSTIADSPSNQAWSVLLSPHNFTKSLAGPIPPNIINKIRYNPIDAGLNVPAATRGSLQGYRSEVPALDLRPDALDANAIFCPPLQLDASRYLVANDNRLSLMNLPITDFGAIGRSPNSISFALPSALPVSLDNSTGILSFVAGNFISPDSSSYQLMTNLQSAIPPLNLNSLRGGGGGGSGSSSSGGGLGGSNGLSLTKHSAQSVIDTATCLLVSNLPTTCTENWLRTLFSTVGTVLYLKLFPQYANSNCAIVYMSTTKESLFIFQHFNGYLIGNNAIQIVLPGSQYVPNLGFVGLQRL